MIKRWRRKLRDSIAFDLEIFKNGEQLAVGSIKDYNNNGLGAALQIEVPDTLLVGESYDLKLHQAGDFYEETGVLVYKNGMALGLSTRITKNLSLSIRNYERITLNEFIQPSGFAPHPTIFGDKIFFRVVDISRDGAGLLSDRKLKYIKKGMVLKASLIFPMIGMCDTNLTVEATSQQGKYLRIGTRYSDSAKVHQLLCEYLLVVEEGINPQSLKSRGYHVKSVAGCDFQYASAEDLARIVDLRKKAYSASNERLSSLPSGSFTDPFDAFARHMVYIYNDQIVASARAIHCNGRLETTELFGSYKLDPQSAPKDGFVEVSKFCVDPDFRNTDMFQKLVLQCIRISYEVNAAHIVCSATDQLVPVYERIGFRRFSNPFLNTSHDIRLNPLIANVEVMLQLPFALELKMSLGY